MTTKRKAYFPQRTFDDALTALAELYVKEGWAYVSPEALTRAAVAQRKEREAFDALTVTYLQQKEAFARAQHKRHADYQAALAAARGVHRNDPAITKMLEPFRRQTKRSAKLSRAA